MRMAELSGQSGVPVATIKYYLREGLLPPGERTSPNQARYGEAHVRRLRLIRGMLDVGGLSINQVREVLAAVDSGETGPHAVFGVAQAMVTRPGLAEDDDREDAVWAREQVAALIGRMGWQVPADAASASALAALLVQSRELGEADLLDRIDARARLMQRMAELDLADLDARPDLDSRVWAVIAGTVLGDAIAATLRRMAQQHASAIRYGLLDRD